MKQELVPIFRVPRSDQNQIDSHATATLMRFKDAFFIATASHVFRHNDIGAIMLAGPSGILTFTRPATVTNPTGYDRESDPIDFAVVLLTPSEKNFLSRDYRFLDPMNLPPLDHDDRHAFCHFVGYPCSRNVPRIAESILPSELFRVDAKTDKQLLKHSETPRHKSVPEDYIALRYDPRRTHPDPQHPVPRLKDLAGMSGGAIYAGLSPADDIVTRRKHTSHHYIGMLLQKSPRKRPGGEVLVYGLSLLAIQKILRQWFETEMIQQGGGRVR